ncbi:transposase [Spirosoma flavum]|uniref:Transposase n=1 Tax=Spirosoma flavum TaxID=2048557 RepID=A0ABW6ANY8_9BACT
MPLLFDAHCFNILFDSFKFYNEKYKAKLLAYALMNNHVHFIIFFEHDKHLINYLRDFKKFTSLKPREYIQIQQAEQLQHVEYEHRT